MNAEEYSKVKNMRYADYCAYLQKKYGLSKKPYMSQMWSKSQGMTRTREGLFLHHIREDTAVQLSDPAHAKNCPYEYQLPENLCFCDWLEHFFLHVLICEHPAMKFNGEEMVGIGGITNFFVPELSDMYSGYRPGKPWRQTCFKKVEGDKDVYVSLVRRFILDRQNKEGIPEICASLYSSMSDGKGWDIKNNYALWVEIVSPYLGKFRRRSLARGNKPMFAKTSDPKKQKRRKTLIILGVVVLALILLSLLLI